MVAKMASSAVPEETNSIPQTASDAEPAAEKPWHVLEGVGPETDSFPARARLAGESIVIVRTRTGLRGIERRCPHMQATMMNAELAANDTMVRCPLHVFTFKLSDGKGVNCPGFRIQVYEIKAENGVLMGRSAN